MAAAAAAVVVPLGTDPLVDRIIIIGPPPIDEAEGKGIVANEELKEDKGRCCS